MNWTELSIVVNHEVEYDVTDILESHGSNGVVIEDSKDLVNQPADKFGEIYELNPDDYPDSMNSLLMTRLELILKTQF